MIKITGEYAAAKIFTDDIEQSALSQIKTLCDQPFAKGAKIRIMPDVHAGAGCVIGFTASLGEMVIPNIVGVDIGCGMLTVELGKIAVDFDGLDKLIRKNIPSGFDVRGHPLSPCEELDGLKCLNKVGKLSRIKCSLGTLGGGNHFIELDKDDDGNVYLVIHTGSRNLGKQVAEIYQRTAIQNLCGLDDYKTEKQKIIDGCKRSGREKDIEMLISELNERFKDLNSTIPPELCYLTGKNYSDYLNDMKICQQFAADNRAAIAEIIVNFITGKKPGDFPRFETIHNYIDLESCIIRKGAVSAKEGERLLIPINMRDGSLICTGKGNADWNFSAPHGAGRKYSRTEARHLFTEEQFREQMEGIFTTSANKKTIDECPMAYKNMDEILENIQPAAKVEKIIKPVYNFKAEGDGRR
ncbi:MAG: RtcB family protein [Clostridia bacterium]|nr:RtcB family protein [Clostridia bacterium]